MKISGSYLVVLLLIFTHPILAQQEEENNRRNHVYVGVQTNQLVRQLVNFGGTGTFPSTPYLFNISINSKEKGNGVNFGFGYSFDRFDDGDQNFDRTTKVNDFALRIGYEKKTKIWERWQIIWGIDALVTDNKNETTVEIPIGNNVTTEITTVNRTYQFGAGGRFGLNFFLSNKIVLGTEMSYYLKSGRTKFFEGDVDGDPDRDSKVSSFKPELPGVLYLIVRF